MKHFLFNGNESPDEIKRILLDNCEGVEDMTFTEQLSEEQLAELREVHTDNCIEIGKHNEVLKEAKDAHKEAVKPLSTDNKDILKTLRTRHKEINGKVYRLANLDNGMMEYVNEKGHVVSSRRLKPEEKQTRVFPLQKAVNE